MSKIKIVGLDIAIRNLGLALGEFDIDTEELQVSQVKLVETKLDKVALKTVRKSSEDLRTATEIAQAIKDAVVNWEPMFFVAEVPFGGQSARAAFCFGMVTGMLAGSRVFLRPPFIEVTPAEVQKAALGYRGKDKDGIIDWATTTWPDAGWARGKVKGELRLLGKNEHMADACAAIKAGIATPQFRQALAFMRAQAA